MSEYNTRQAQMEEDTRVATAMRKAEDADEKYKANHCILCPKCKRIMERLSGCDLMVCGRNYHGGDQQDGCGNQFNITTAPKYVAKNAQERKVQDVTVSKPEAETKHEIIKGINMLCDACQQVRTNEWS